MTVPEQSFPAESGYVLDSESATEMARLLLQDRLISEMMGGLFPEQKDLDGIERILDIGCGPGGWALDVARSFPKKELTGIDISEMMLAYANQQKKIHALKNIHFRKMDARQKLLFSDRSFDLVNIRAASACIPRQTWPLLLQECARVTRPGGILRLTDGDRMGLTNSAPFEQYAHYFTQLLTKMEYGFAVETHTIGMSLMSEKLLQDAGYVNIQMKPYVLDFSYGTPLYPIQLQNSEISFHLLQPRFIEMGIATKEELEKNYEACIRDMGQETFCAIGYLFTFWGTLQ